MRVDLGPFFQPIRTTSSKTHGGYGDADLDWLDLNVDYFSSFEMLGHVSFESKANENYFTILKHILNSLPAVESLHLSILPDHLDFLPAHDSHLVAPALLLSEVTIPNLKNFRLLSAEVDTAIMCAFLNHHWRYLSSVVITNTHGPIACAVYGLNGTWPDPPQNAPCPLALPNLTYLEGPDAFFRHLSPNVTVPVLKSKPEPGSRSGSGSNPTAPALELRMQLASACIVWQDDPPTSSGAVASVLTALGHSQESLRSLECWRLGPNPDLIESLSGRFPNLERLKILCLESRDDKLNEVSMYRLSCLLYYVHFYDSLCG